MAETTERKLLVCSVNFRSSCFSHVLARANKSRFTPLVLRSKCCLYVAPQLDSVLARRVVCCRHLVCLQFFLSFGQAAPAAAQEPQPPPIEGESPDGSV